MKDYKKTIVENNKYYVNKELILSNRELDGLYKTNDEEVVAVKINKKGELFCSLAKNGRRKELGYSLRKIGIEFLGLNDPSVQTVLKYLITPEMEVERIMNCLRYKYLECINLSGKIKDPSSRISSEYNNAFQAMYGIPVYQGNTKIRRDNESYWKDAGFDKKSIDRVNFEKEKNEVAFIFSYLRNLKLEDYDKIFAELYAMKPGFHEIFIHKDYFDKGETYRRKPHPDDKPKEKVLILLRGYGNLKASILNIPHNLGLNRDKYVSYAACSITQGPFVLRKRPSVSYFKEIRNIKAKGDIERLGHNFHFLDYYINRIEDTDSLGEILEKASQYKRYVIP